MAAHQKIDWLLARQNYLSDVTLSYADIAKKYGVSKKSVADKGLKEGWTELRQNLSDKAYENFQKKLLAQKEAAQDRHLQQFQNVQALINKSINAIAQQEQPDALELRRLSGALKDVTMGERIVLGLPTSVGAITDPQGNDAFKGLAELFYAARNMTDESKST